MAFKLAPDPIGQPLDGLAMAWGHSFLTACVDRVVWISFPRHSNMRDVARREMLR